MAKKRKKVEIIEIDYEVAEKDREKPLCFNQKCSYCNFEICGIEWYNSCNPEGGEVWSEKK